MYDWSLIFLILAMLAGSLEIYSPSPVTGAVARFLLGVSGFLFVCSFAGDLAHRA